MLSKRTTTLLEQKGNSWPNLSVSLKRRFVVLFVHPCFDQVIWFT
ncbi:hypothetical protein BIW11_07612 [Tropilaelaps mercedesae]|uniref:Uncharacterized protein n=1 Tax=Tropilaelaps mercedesae TaxID=418985 RepID=A0A1V9XT88_9ACAR|nr:hypothetical protein BIW11_07612 [Tropilaelaps mercedesae]